MKKNSKLQFNCEKRDQAGISVLLVIIILSSLLIMIVVLSDIVIRVARGSRQIGHSETAYYAAEIAIEKALYQIEKNRTIVDLDGTTGSLDWIDNVSWNLDVVPVTTSSSYQVTLESGESYQLDLDFLGLSYPNNIRFSWSGGDAEVFAQADDGTIETDDNSPHNLNASTGLYVVKITNTDSSDITLTINPNSDMPTGILVTGTGNYQEETRVVEVERKNWQIY